MELPDIIKLSPGARAVFKIIKDDGSELVLLDVVNPAQLTNDDGSKGEANTGCHYIVCKWFLWKRDLDAWLESLWLEISEIKIADLGRRIKIKPGGEHG